MGFMELFIQMLLLGVGLSMDAFAVSISNGLGMKKIILKKALLIALTFGLFQALMPMLGYFLGATFAEFVERFDHYIALIFLGFIGVKMIIDGVKELKSKDKADEEETKKVDLSFTGLMFQAVATSIDALVVGVSFVAMKMSFTDMLIGITIIGITTFILSLIGVFAGKKFGDLLGSRAEIIGGLILVGIGLKVFIEHTLS